jgi:hypothetical protein
MDEGQEVINLLCIEAGLDSGGLWQPQEVSCIPMLNTLNESPQFPTAASK